jgi:trans-aconitate methyltransferase
LRFARGDIAAFAAPGRYDWCFPTRLHWLPDHPALFARLTTALRPERQLAVQLPTNFDQPSHVVAAAVAAEKVPQRAWWLRRRPAGARAGGLRGAALPARLREQTVRLRTRTSCQRATMSSWVKGSLADRVRAPHARRPRPHFLAATASACAEPMRAAASPFKRLLIWGAL